MPCDKVNQTRLASLHAVPMPSFELEVQRAGMPGAPKGRAEGSVMGGPREGCDGHHRTTGNPDGSTRGIPMRRLDIFNHIMPPRFFERIGDDKDIGKRMREVPLHD